MRARSVNEYQEFKRTGDTKRSLNLGYGNKPQTKAWKVLKFIKDSGDEGRSFTEIQKFIWNLNKLNPEDFYKEKIWLGSYEDKKGKWYFPYEYKEGGPRTSRGYWATYLYGAARIKGLLPSFCKKNEKGKWVIKRWPRGGENLALREYP